MRVTAFLAAILFCASSHSLELQDLLDEDQLRISTWITPQEDIAVGQEVLLTIEIATPRWFAGGTRIRHPEVPQLVVLQRDQFATNLSRREEGETWVVQRWTLELYPQKAGVYSVPPIELELAVNHAEEGIVKGTLDSVTVSFTARIPQGLERESNWVAANTFRISQSIEPEPVQLKPGDAVQREVRIVASHLSAMMLPALSTESIDGVSSYPEAPELQDRSNRGEATAERIERVTYVIEKPGQYMLPEQVFYWWNTSKQQLETEVLESITLDAGVAVVGGAQSAASASRSGRAAISGVLAWWPLIPGLMVAIAAIYLLRRWRAAAPSERAILAEAEHHLRKGDPQKAVTALYRWLNSFQPAPDWYQLRNAASRQASPELREHIELLLKEVYTGKATNAGDMRGVTRVTPAAGFNRKNTALVFSTVATEAQPR